MTFLNSLKKWFYTNNSSAAGSAARIPLLDANGVAVGSDTYNAISEIVRQELGKILNTGTVQTTGITKVPSLVGNALGATTVANLASVLSGVTNGTLSPTDNWDSLGVGRYFVAFSSAPTGVNFPIVDGVSAYAYGLLEVIMSERVTVQIYTPDNIGSGDDTHCIYARSIWDNTTNRAWSRIASNIPFFYKNYANESALAAALGVKGTDTLINVGAGETKTITFPSAGFYIVGNTGGSSPLTIISISQDNNDIVSMGSTINLDINTDNGKQLVLIKSTGLNCSLKNNASVQREFLYRKVLF